MHLNFLEAIGALTLIFGGLYLWLNNEDQKTRDIKFLIWLLDHDSEAKDEFLQNYCNYISESDYECRKALRKFFTEEKLKEVNRRIEEKESAS